MDIVTWKGSLDALNMIEPSPTFQGLSPEDLCESGGSFYYGRKPNYCASGSCPNSYSRRSCVLPRTSGGQVMDGDLIRRLEPKLAKYIDLFDDCFDRKETRAVHATSAFRTSRKRAWSRLHQTPPRRSRITSTKQGSRRDRSLGPGKTPAAIRSPTPPSTDRLCTASS